MSVQEEKNAIVLFSSQKARNSTFPEEITTAVACNGVGNLSQANVLIFNSQSCGANPLYTQSHSIRNIHLGKNNNGTRGEKSSSLRGGAPADPSIQQPLSEGARLAQQSLTGILKCGGEVYLRTLPQLCLSSYYSKGLSYDCRIWPEVKQGRLSQGSSLLALWSKKRKKKIEKRRARERDGSVAGCTACGTHLLGFEKKRISSYKRLLSHLHARTHWFWESVFKITIWLTARAKCLVCFFFFFFGFIIWFCAIAVIYLLPQPQSFVRKEAWSCRRGDLWMWWRRT